MTIVIDFLIFPVVWENKGDEFDGTNHTGKWVCIQRYSMNVKAIIKGFQ